eukprot:EG_transcript_1560
MRSKLIPLNKVENTVFLTKKCEASSSSGGPGRSAAVREEDEEGSEIRPVRWLYDRQKIEGFMRWSTVAGAGAGMNNLGNSCFMNSVLQTLTYIPPLRNFIATITKEHGQRYQDVQGFDPLNTLRRLFSDVCSGQRVISPDYVFRNLKRLARSFRPGRQEDAQEFALYMLEACHDALLRAAGGKVDARTAETTAIHQIFGGYLRSQVQWSKEDELRRLKAKSAGSRTGTAPSVGNTSDTYDPFLILSIEIKGDSIEKCLQHFTRPEMLDSRNMYKTPSGVYVTATKRFTIFQPPRVLTLHLKRFNAMRGFVRGMDFGKINQMVAYPETLSLAPFCSKPAKSGNNYLLIGVVVHEGSSVHSGHYYSYVRAANSAWYCCDDSRVRQVGLQEALRQRAYMLVYLRKDPPPPSSAQTSRPIPTSPALKPKSVAAAASASATPVPTTKVPSITSDASRAVSPASSDASSVSISTAESGPGAPGGKKRKRQQVESCDVLRSVESPNVPEGPSNQRMDAALKDVAHLHKKRRDREKQADLSKRLHNKVFQHANADPPAPDTTRRLLIRQPSGPPASPSSRPVAACPPKPAAAAQSTLGGSGGSSNGGTPRDPQPQPATVGEANGPKEGRLKKRRKHRHRKAQAQLVVVVPEQTKESCPEIRAPATSDNVLSTGSGGGEASAPADRPALRPKKRKRSRTADASVTPADGAASHVSSPRLTPRKELILPSAGVAETEPNLELKPTPAKVVQTMDMKSLAKALGDAEPREVWESEAARQAAAQRRPTVDQLDRRPTERPGQDKEWDKAYDQGRQQKVKKPRLHNSQEDSNPFQRASDHKGKAKSWSKETQNNWHGSQQSWHGNQQWDQWQTKPAGSWKNGATNHSQNSNGFLPGNKWRKKAYQ